MKVQKRLNIYTKAKNQSVADVFVRSVSKQELQLNRYEQNHLTPQIEPIVVNKTNQRTPLKGLLKYKHVLPTQTKDCHAFLAGFGKGRICILFH